MQGLGHHPNSSNKTSDRFTLVSLFVHYNKIPQLQETAKLRWQLNNVTKFR